MATTGTIDKIDYTSGGAGNQWTTIDGKRYATWFDFRDPKLKGLRSGAKVEFTTSTEKLWSSDATPTLCAEILRVIPVTAGAAS